MLYRDLCNLHELCGSPSGRLCSVCRGLCTNPYMLSWIRAVAVQAILLSLAEIGFCVAALLEAALLVCCPIAQCKVEGIFCCLSRVGQSKIDNRMI